MNPQFSALIQNVLMIGGSYLVSTGTLSAPDAQTIAGAIAAIAGFALNHFSAVAPAPTK